MNLKIKFGHGETKAKALKLLCHFSIKGPHRWCNGNGAPLDCVKIVGSSTGLVKPKIYKKKYLLTPC